MNHFDDQDQFISPTLNRMGCICSSEEIDFDLIEPLILRACPELETIFYRGTTERKRYQTVGRAQLAITNDCIYSQVIDKRWCLDSGLLRVPILSIKNIRLQSHFNGQCRFKLSHLVITYIITDVKGTHQYEAAWQMSNDSCQQWKTTIEQLLDRYPVSERA